MGEHHKYKYSIIANEIMIKTIIAWLIWILGIGVILGLDYVLRIRDDNILTGSLPEPIGLTLIIILSISCIVLLALGLKKLSIWKRVIIVGIQIPIGYLILIRVLLYYVCYAGIDCV